MLPQLQPYASQRDSCRFPAGCFPVSLPTPISSPRKLHFSLRAPGFKPASEQLCVHRSTHHHEGPLVRSLAPSAHQEQSVHSTRAYLTRYVPPASFLTTLPVYSALPRPRIVAPGFTHGVSALQGNSRSVEADFISEIDVPHGVGEMTTASNSGKSRVISMHLQGFTPSLRP